MSASEIMRFITTKEHDDMFTDAIAFVMESMQCTIDDNIMAQHPKILWLGFLKSSAPL